jgi:hypothetical protein
MADRLAVRACIGFLAEHDLIDQNAPPAGDAAVATATRRSCHPDRPFVGAGGRENLTAPALARRILSRFDRTARLAVQDRRQRRRTDVEFSQE